MIQFKGFQFRYTKHDDVLVVFLSTAPIIARDFLGKEIDADGESYMVYESTDPYAPPFVSRGHKNRGKFAELRVSKKGESFPNPYDGNMSTRNI